MKPSEIQAGKIYCNKGAGRTKRKVIGIGDEFRPANWYGLRSWDAPKEPGVEFITIGGRDDGKTQRLYLSSFASWVGKESGE